MTLLLAENFEQLITASDKYSMLSHTSISAIKPRSGARSVRILGSGPAYYFTVFYPGASTYSSSGVVGFAVYIEAALPWNVGGDGYGLLQLMNPTAGKHLSLVARANGELGIYAAGTYIGASAPQVLRSASWFYIELKYEISASCSANSVQVYVDGVLVYTLPTGTNTLLGSDPAVARFSFGAVHSNNITNYDDIYICDLQGTVNNDVLGPVKMETLAPNGDGTYSQFTGSDADSVNNYQLVDELPANNTDYVADATAGNRDSYVYSDLSETPASVKAVVLETYLAKSDSGLRAAATFTRIASTDYDNAEAALGESYAIRQDVLETSPATSAAWTESEINALEAGVKVGT